MPGLDGTGPAGRGPITGGGRGYCAVVLNDQNEKVFSGYGFCTGGRGRGFRNRFFSTGMPGWRRAQKGLPLRGPVAPASSKEEALSMLKKQAEAIQQELDVIQSRVKDLENQ